MHKLRCVYTDLSTNTMCIARPEIRGKLRGWLTGIKERRIKVLTYVKGSSYSDHKYLPLEIISSADPNWSQRALQTKDPNEIS